MNLERMREEERRYRDGLQKKADTWAKKKKQWAAARLK
jgi:hypothetical protein